MAVNASATPSAVAATLPDENMIGRMLGQNYRVLELLGVGGMGVVYLVEHVTLKKRFAAKVLASELAKHEEALARFEAEAHAASKLDHDNIVSIIDYGHNDDGVAFIVMELLRGENLHQRLTHGTLPLEEIIAIIVPVCQALQYAHSQGVVHRDMKLENVFLTHKGLARPVVKVLDFGVSKVRESQMRDSRLTKQGQILGSPEYMSPEAARGADVDARADIYAVGIMLYELLCGTVPFRAENYLQVLQKHLTEAPVPPSKYRPDLPLALEGVVLRALAKDRNARHQSMEELEVDLLAAAPELAQRALFVPTHTPPAGIRIQTPSGELTAWSPTPSQLEAERPYSTGGLRRGEAEKNASEKHKGLAAVALAPTQTTLQSAEMPALPPSMGGVAPASSTPKWIFAVAALVVVVVGFFGIRAMQGGGDGSGTSVAAKTAADVNAATPPAGKNALVTPSVIDKADAAPTKARLVVTTDPPGAEVSFDGTVLGTTPLDIAVDALDTTRKLTVVASGFHSVEQELVVRGDREFSFALVADAPETPVVPKTKTKTKKPAGTAKPPQGGLELKSGR